MHDFPAKNQWTRTRTITAAGNRTCIITLRLSDFKSQTSLTLLLRHYELTNENVSYFLTNQSKTKTFIDLKVTRKPKPTKNSIWHYLNEIAAHFTHEILSKDYDIIGVNLFLCKLMRFLRKRTDNSVRSILLVLKRTWNMFLKKYTCRLEVATQRDCLEELFCFAIMWLNLVDIQSVHCCNVSLHTFSTDNAQQTY